MKAFTADPAFAAKLYASQGCAGAVVLPGFGDENVDSSIHLMKRPVSNLLAVFVGLHPVQSDLQPEHRDLLVKLYGQLHSIKVLGANKEFIGSDLQKTTSAILDVYAKLVPFVDNTLPTRYFYPFFFFFANTCLF